MPLPRPTWMKSCFSTTHAGCSKHELPRECPRSRSVPRAFPWHATLYVEPLVASTILSIQCDALLAWDVAPALPSRNSRLPPFPLPADASPPLHPSRILPSAPLVARSSAMFHHRHLIPPPLPHKRNTGTLHISLSYYILLIFFG